MYDVSIYIYIYTYVYIYIYIYVISYLYEELGGSPPSRSWHANAPSIPGTARGLVRLISYYLYS